MRRVGGETRLIRVHPTELGSWCRVHLGSTIAETLFTAGHLSVVIGLRLVDGRQVVVKVRPSSPRVKGCVEVQRALHEAGFPCPEPVVGPLPFGESLLATAESYVGGGIQLDPAVHGRTARSARALADLVSLAEKTIREVPCLDPPLPWTWPNPEALWPPPDDLDVDLNALEGPEWLDDLAGEVRQRLLLSRDRAPVIGHADFESQNLRWTEEGQQLRAVHDWDSVAALPEPVMAGLASAIFTFTGERGTEATVEESSAFLESYEADRGLIWSRRDLSLAWAAGLWVRAFDAKKALARGDPTPGERLRAESAQRRSKVKVAD